MTQTQFTGQDFLDAFAKHYGYTVKETTKPTAVLLPHIMMGVAYEYYLRDIKKLELKQKCKLYRSRWAEAYTKFNRYLFDAFDLDMQDAFCDKMDEFRRFMYQDLTSLQAKMMRCLPECMDSEKRRVMASAMLTNKIAKLAEKMWHTCYAKEVAVPVNGKETRVIRVGCINNGISGVLTNTKAFGMEYSKGIKEFNMYVEDEVADDLFKGIEDFERKCLRFIDFDKQNN